jgi:hypothetical protein
MLSSTCIQGRDTSSQGYSLVIDVVCRLVQGIIPYMVLTGGSPRLITNINLNGLCDVVSEHGGFRSNG